MTTLTLTDIDDIRVYYTGPRGPAFQTWAVLRTLGEPHWRHLLDAASGAAISATNAAAFWHGGRPTAEGAAHAAMDARARAEQMGLDAVVQQVAGQRALAILYPFIPTPEQVRGAREHLTPAQVHACEQAARATMHTLSATERVRRNTSEDLMPVTLSRAQLPTFAHDLVVAEIARRWEAREGAPANPTAGPWRLSELCAKVGCPMPTGALKPITDALGVALGNHHLLHTRPLQDVTPLQDGGSGRVDATDALLTVIDVAALSPEARRRYGLG